MNLVLGLKTKLLNLLMRSYFTSCSVFEAERPGCRFSVQQRIATYFYKVPEMIISRMPYALEISVITVTGLWSILVHVVISRFCHILYGMRFRYFFVTVSCYRFPSFYLNWMSGIFFIQGILYGSVGFGCGIVGQGIANAIMTAKRYRPCW